MRHLLLMAASILSMQVVLTMQASAKDFGILGDTFEIIEVDLVTHFEGKVSDLRESGRLKEIQDGMVETSKKRIMEPSPVLGLSAATQYRSYHYDPTIVAPQDYLDHEGNVVAAKGTEKNPLDFVSMREDLLFIDGRRESEIKWAIEEREKRDGAVKIILTAGRPFEIMKEAKFRVFFDQRGLISRRFGFSKTPARVSQDDRLLLVEEIVVK